MRANEYLMAPSLLDKPSPWMTSSEKSNRGEQNEEKEVTQRGVAQTSREDPGSDAGRGRWSFGAWTHFLQRLSDAACFKVKHQGLDRTLILCRVCY